MQIEEANIILKDFIKGKIEKDKLENYRGGYKMGYFYTVDIQESIETVLNELEKKDKVIDEMAEYIIELIKYNNPEEERDKEEIKEYFYKRVQKQCKMINFYNKKV